ncbi:unnamed protein product [Hymenolepis diminuta]|uniref:Uncharacterized protein n=1 Tax=Hymenolepis diminuta TaxID=6216 RepID=A0A564YF43_HYMDI|nr:unnamed protein product [Hymenolepis diminuta]
MRNCKHLRFRYATYPLSYKWIQQRSRCTHVTLELKNTRDPAQSPARQLLWSPQKALKKLFR